jgi:two-component system, chemotaxis family, chemotaxis protein CheY
MTEISTDKKRCLIVDDSKVIRSVARKIVEDLGFEIEEAANGQAALESCQRRMPDAILLDWNMPVMDGIHFLRTLRGMPDGQLPRVLFCTTEKGMHFMQQAIEAGANEYIMKPFDSEIVQLKFSRVGLI